MIEMSLDLEMLYRVLLNSYCDKLRPIIYNTLSAIDLTKTPQLF